MRVSNLSNHTQEIGKLTNLPVLDRRPLEALGVQAEGEEGGEQDDGLDADLLALVVLGLGGPVEEGDNVLGHLGRRRGSAWLTSVSEAEGASKQEVRTVIVLDKAVKQHTGHTDGTTREEGVVVHPLTDLDTGRGVDVAREQRENVVLE